FADLCERIAGIWREQRAEIGAQNEQVLQAFARTLPKGAAAPSEWSAAVVRAMLDNLRANFDGVRGGFGSAPKFPHPPDLELCLREGEKDIALLTLERMCEGGIYDQLGGGFCRYSVDAEWSIPHFEKMLYDNGPLLRAKFREQALGPARRPSDGKRSARRCRACEAVRNARKARTARPRRESARVLECARHSRLGARGARV